MRSLHSRTQPWLPTNMGRCAKTKQLRSFWSEFILNVGNSGGLLSSVLRNPVQGLMFANKGGFWSKRQSGYYYSYCVFHPLVLPVLIWGNTANPLNLKYEFMRHSEVGVFYCQFIPTFLITPNFLSYSRLALMESLFEDAHNKRNCNLLFFLTDKLLRQCFLIPQ